MVCYEIDLHSVPLGASDCRHIGPFESQVEPLSRHMSVSVPMLTVNTCAATVETRETSSTG